MSSLQRLQSEYVTGAPLPLSFPDPGDLPFIEVAVAGAIDAIVTGSVMRFRPAEGPLDILMLTPRRFLDWLAGARG